MNVPANPSAGPADAEKSWDARILELIDPGIDATLIAENLKRSPDERLRRMLDMVAFSEAVRGRDRHR